MNELDIRINQVDYVGVLTRPAFSLWGEGKILLATLFSAFQPYNVRLTDISGTGSEDSIADQEVSVKLGSAGTFRFRFDRIEARLANYSEEELIRFPLMVERGVFGLKEAASTLPFATHLLVHASHSVIPGVPSHEYFRALLPQRELAIGVSRGHGFIFHFDIPDRSWRMQLTLDHSLSIPDGIYINFSLLITADRIDYQQVFKDARELFRQCLREVGLSLRAA